MTAQNENEAGLEIPSLSELRGRQSVRATFRLSGRAIEAISVAATHMGIKQKSLFDHLMDDIRSLERVAREIEHQRFLELKRVQKTFVLSRRTLHCLEEAAKVYDMPRDALVEYSISRLLPIIDAERKKHEKRKEVIKEIGEYLSDGEAISERIGGMLGHDDILFEKFNNALSNLNSACRDMAGFVEKSKVIEDF